MLDQLGYSRWDGAVYFDADATADQQYRLTFEQGENKDYQNSAITWSAIATPLLSHKVDVGVVPVAGDTYSISIDGVDISYTARAASGSTPADTTTAQPVAGLVEAINGGGLFGAIAAEKPHIQINDGDAAGKAEVVTTLGTVGALELRNLPFQALTATAIPCARPDRVRAVCARQPTSIPRRATRTSAWSPRSPKASITPTRR